MENYTSEIKERRPPRHKFKNIVDNRHASRSFAQMLEYHSASEPSKPKVITEERALEDICESVRGNKPRPEQLINASLAFQSPPLNAPQLVTQHTVKKSFKANVPNANAQPFLKITMTEPDTSRSQLITPRDRSPIPEKLQLDDSEDPVRPLMNEEEMSPMMLQMSDQKINVRQLTSQGSRPGSAFSNLGRIDRNNRSPW